MRTGLWWRAFTSIISESRTGHTSPYKLSVKAVRGPCQELSCQGWFLYRIQGHEYFDPYVAEMLLVQTEGCTADLNRLRTLFTAAGKVQTASATPEPHADCRAPLS